MPFLLVIFAVTMGQFLFHVNTILMIVFDAGRIVSELATFS